MKAKYQKKPIIIEAIQWTGDNISELRTEFPNFAEKSWIVGKNNDLFLDTLENPMRASIGDYIIRGIKGEFYACKPDIFMDTYDKVEEGQES